MRPAAFLRRLTRPGGPVPLIERLSRESDPAFDLLFADSGAGMMALDHAGRVLRVNAALRQMVAPGIDLAPGAPGLHLIAEADRPAVRKSLRSVLAGRPPSLEMSARIMAADADAQVALSVVPVREADGEIGGLLLRFTDLTARRLLEAQLAHALKLQAVGQLAGGIAHDFNNLLTAVLGATDLVLARGAAVDAETREDVRQIRRSAERGADLVRHLLAFGRQQALQPRVIAVNDAVGDLARLLVRVLGARIRLQLELETPGRLVCVDPTGFDQVLMNLAVNARDAMPDGGTLTLRTGHVTLYNPLIQGVETIPPGRYVLVEVHDTGIGIPAEILPRVCDPFFTTKRQHGGSGLGLSTVHGIVRQSGGVFTVESEVGEGTRARVYLPRHDQPDIVTAGSPSPAAAARIAPPAASRSGSRTVLLVDDEDSVRQLAARALTRLGWHVLAASSGEEALRLLAGSPDGTAPSVLVSDVVMPGMDGPALVRAVRESYPGLPAILVSGYAATTPWDDSDRTDVVFLPKPYTLKALVAEVGRVAAPVTAPVTAPIDPGASTSPRSLDVPSLEAANTDGTMS